MFKAAGIIGVFTVCVFLLSGCATTSRKNLETQGLRNQISVLESQLQAKDSEIAELRLALTDAQSPKDSAALKAAGETKSRPKVKDIQLALRNAGYNPGPVDGKMGAKTREAIRAFQRENGLSADGKVGKKTWDLLRAYLTQKVK
ncbi:MAG: peptidoglycan-binding domain-containing protein [Candidatus Omnitrophica bacterium]|nr:peptidoglycan-binding domain-containing protein [Candidatus Omnitrophota bacterium]